MSSRSFWAWAEVFLHLNSTVLSLGRLSGMLSVVFDNFSTIAPGRSLDMESDFAINGLHGCVQVRVL